MTSTPLATLATSRCWLLQVDPKKRLEAEVATLMGTSILQVLGTMVDTVVF